LFAAPNILVGHIYHVRRMSTLNF